MIEPGNFSKFPYSPLGKAFEKQIKTTEYQGRKQVESLNIFKTLYSTNNN